MGSTTAASALKAAPFSPPLSRDENHITGPPPSPQKLAPDSIPLAVGLSGPSIPFSRPTRHRHVYGSNRVPLCPASHHSHRSSHERGETNPVTHSSKLYDPTLVPQASNDLSGYVLYDPVTPHMPAAWEDITPPESVDNGNLYDERSFIPAGLLDDHVKQLPLEVATHPQYVDGVVIKMLADLRQAVAYWEVLPSVTTVHPQPPLDSIVGITTPPTTDISVEENKDSVASNGASESVLAPTLPEPAKTEGSLPNVDLEPVRIDRAALEPAIHPRPDEAIRAEKISDGGTQETSGLVPTAQSSLKGQAISAPAIDDATNQNPEPEMEPAVRLPSRVSQIEGKVSPSPDIARPETPKVVAPRPSAEENKEISISRTRPKSARRETMRTKSSKPARLDELTKEAAPPQGSSSPSPASKTAPGQRCCPTEVPMALLMILDNTGGLHAQMAKQYISHANKLCPSHHQQFQQLALTLGFRLPPSKPTPTVTPKTESSKKKRAIAPRPLPESKPEQTPGSRIPPVPGVPKPDVATSKLSKAKSEQRSFVGSSSAANEIPAQNRSMGSSTRGIDGSPTSTLNPSLTPRMLGVQSENAALTQGTSIPVKRPAPRSIEPQTQKRRRLNPPLRPISRDDGVRPVHNGVRDSAYRAEMVAELRERIQQNQGKSMTHGMVTDDHIVQLLEKSTHPNLNPQIGPVEALLLSGDEALAVLENGSPQVPIFTERQQTFRWGQNSRPICELFRRMEDLERDVSVQIPSRLGVDESFESRGLTAVKDRFLARQNTDDPWNILDLRSPVPAAILPAFLTGENCQLLPRLRDAVLQGDRAERGTGTRDQWNEWRDVLEWVLLSEGGHNTAPHTDSHGLATWISVQEGLFGFGWMALPTKVEMETWFADPQQFMEARWRYIILEPGQTIFFNSGTVHFVFRLKSQQTLALGGHILQWSGIERWIQVVSAQMNNPNITNEDMEWSAPKYVRVVAELMERRLKNGRADEMGGDAAVHRLLALLKEFDEKYVRPRAKKSKSKKKRIR